MIAILSDIHANLEALRAVIEDIESRDVDRLICLGDTVGFGPNPSECVSIVQDFSLCLSGSWDVFVAGTGEDSESNLPLEKLALLYEWTRSRLTHGQLEFLGACHSIKKLNGVTFAHGHPIYPLFGYLFPEQIYEKDLMKKIFSEFEGIFLCGHTHIPGVFTESTFSDPNEFEDIFEVQSESVIINVGSVGQPRDGDYRACYVLREGNRFEFVRVPYDVEATRRKVIDLLPPELWT